MTKLAGGIDVVLGVLVEPLGGQHGLDDVLEDVGVEIFVRDGVGVLAGDDDGVNARWLAVLAVLDRDLAFAVGAQVRQLAALAHCGELAAELVRERDGRGHQLGGIVRGVAKHHALVAGAAGVNALGDVARLLVDAGDDGAGVGVEAVKRVVVADGGDDAAHQRLEVDVGLGGDFARDDHKSGGGQSFRSHAAVGVLLQAGIENGVGDLVGNLVGMAFGHGFRGKQKTVAQLGNTPSHLCAPIPPRGGSGTAVHHFYGNCAGAGRAKESSVRRCGRVGMRFLRSGRRCGARRAPTTRFGERRRSRCIHVARAGGAK